MTQIHGFKIHVICCASAGCPILVELTLKTVGFKLPEECRETMDSNLEILIGHHFLKQEATIKGGFKQCRNKPGIH